jgi:putative ABC transport system permease protein
MIGRGPTWEGLIWTGLPVLGCLALLAWRGLGQVRSLSVATARLVFQLLLLAVVLRAIVAANHPAIVLAAAVGMLSAAAHTVGSRKIAGNRWTLRLEAFLAMSVGAGLMITVATRLSLHASPWYDPLTVLPLLGMILGNSVTAVALAAERLESDLRADRDLVELRLSLGATSRQAALPALRAAVAAGLTPIINNMMIVGIVAIPGMTSGQLLAGADVGEAIRYQILLYLAITATVVIATLLLLASRLRRYFTTSHQLRRSSLGD